MLLFSVLFLLLNIAVCGLRLYKFTDHCHLVEIQLQSVNILSYHITKQPHAWSLLPCIYLESLRFITCCVLVGSKFNKLRHRKSCISNRMTGSQLGPCLSLDNTRQFSYRYRHTKDHIVSARSNVHYVTKLG